MQIVLHKVQTHLYVNALLHGQVLIVHNIHQHARLVIVQMAVLAMKHFQACQLAIVQHVSLVTCVNRQLMYAVLEIIHV